MKKQKQKQEELTQPNTKGKFIRTTPKKLPICERMGTPREKP